MAYRLKPSRSVAAEVVRIIDKQLMAASTALRPGPRGVNAGALHAARRRAKKVLAAIRLIRPALVSSPQDAIHVLRDVNRSLAPVSDGDAVVGTLGRVAEGQPSLTPVMTASVRRRLVRFERRVERSARMRRACRRASEALAELPANVREWQLRESGFQALASGLKRSFRRARRSMARAERRPTTKTYHAWRRHSKDHWLQLRLIEARCHGRMIGDQKAVEALDECLGEHHNVALLVDLFVTRPLASRAETVLWLRALRAYRTELRTRASRLGRQIYSERPREFVGRVRRAWRAGSAGHQTTHRPVRTTWRRAA